MAGLVRRFTAIFVAILNIVMLIASAAGFVVNLKAPGYPRPWAPLMTSSDLESMIEGSYECYGTRHSGETDSIYRYLSRGTQGRCNRFTVRKRGEDVLEILIFDDTHNIPDRILDYRKYDDYEVTEDWIEFRQTFSSFRHYFGYDADDNLVVMNKPMGGAPPIPTILVSTEYCRFKRLK